MRIVRVPTVIIIIIIIIGMFFIVSTSSQVIVIVIVMAGGMRMSKGPIDVAQQRQGGTVHEVEDRMGAVAPSLVLLLVMMMVMMMSSQARRHNRLRAERKNQGVY